MTTQTETYTYWVTYCTIDDSREYSWKCKVRINETDPIQVLWDIGSERFYNFIIDGSNYMPDDIIIIDEGTGDAEGFSLI